MFDACSTEGSDRPWWARKRPHWGRAGAARAAWRPGRMSFTLKSYIHNSYTRNGVSA
ncbi:hypothetical protein SAMN04488047_101229 [Tranquillimonas alkanivorans]|uniref:Uncharacterized protein n=1 Tax=Tranquillimonas alkanivorans TaxID=441119 RepID=A0A1I5KNK9_9RHOB|nr:hypothetical protein SAMN04488047_101229 [Tranquillimonas alkanivorans]